MSAFIVNDETIHAIVQGIERYGVEFEAEGYKQPNQVIIDRQAKNNGIGQILLNQNYRSVFELYNRGGEIPKYRFREVECNEGTLLGCIQCYIYQACETEGFFETKLYRSLQQLKEAMLRAMIEQQGQKIPWGYGEYPWA